MSGSEDNFLARWSRRKREVEEAEDPPPPLRGRVGEGGEPQPQHPFPSPTPDPAPQGGGEAPPEPLPSLDDLTAESDLSAFMRAGVPEALRKAALRRMWSLDPAIRDHVGLAEYAWDFNNPASMAGFGAVAAGTPMARLAASVMSGQGDRRDLSEVVPETPEEQAPAAEPPSSEVSAHLPTAVAPYAGDGRAPDPSGDLLAQGPEPGPSDAAAAPSREAAPVGEGGARETAVPRHGRAMPRWPA